MENSKTTKEDSGSNSFPVLPNAEDLSYPKEFSMQTEHFDPDKQEEALWMAETGLNRDTLCGAVETVIFMCDKPVSIKKIRDYINNTIPPEAIRYSINELQKKYRHDYHGIALVEVANGVQFRTKEKYSSYVKDVFRVNSMTLTPAKLEVLAFIAYRQPVSRRDIDELRGVDSSHLLRDLMDKRLVRPTGRSSELGRSVLYGTTAEFLEVFNLSDLSQLPPEHELESMAGDGVGDRADISDLLGKDKSSFYHDEVEESDKLRQQIRSISSDTEFTKELKKESLIEQSDSRHNKRNPFEVLNDHLMRKQVAESNHTSSLSEIEAVPKDLSDKDVDDTLDEQR